jgi:hypothetical protein
MPKEKEICTQYDTKKRVLVVFNFDTFFRFFRHNIIQGVSKIHVLILTRSRAC